MNGVCPNCWDWLGWLRYCLAVFPLVASSISAFAACPKEVKSHVVYVEVCEHSCEQNKDPQESATGVLVANNGLILSVYELLGDKKVDLADNSYKVYVSKRKSKGEEQSNNLKGFGENRHEASVMGFDKKRGLLLLKISQELVKEYGLIPAPFGDEELNESELCFVGFARSLEEPISKGSGEVIATGSYLNYQLLTTFEFEESQRGSPVYGLDSSKKPFIVGIASGHPSQGGKWTEVIPIEYADVLISRVFLAKFQSRLSDVSKDVEKAMSNTTAMQGKLRGMEVELTQLRSMEAALRQLKVLKEPTSDQPEWSIQERPDKCRLALVPDKSLSSSRTVVGVEASIEIDYTDQSGVKGKKYSHPSTRINPSKGDSAFCLQGVLRKIDAEKHRAAWSSIEGMTVNIVPVVLDDDEMEAKLEPKKLRPDRYPVSSNN